jgi:calcineurin-like phosphoesterase family protein
VFHFPIASWIDMNKGVIHLHGHTHLPHHLKIGEGRSIDFGMDGNGLKPYELTELFGLVRNQPVRKLVLPKDHHETRLV